MLWWERIASSLICQELEDRTEPLHQPSQDLADIWLDPLIRLASRVGFRHDGVEVIPIMRQARLTEEDQRHMRRPFAAILFLGFTAIARAEEDAETRRRADLSVPEVGGPGWS